LDVNSGFYEPYDPENLDDVKAANRKIEFEYAWFSDPLYYGKYPDSMIQLVGDRLPKFTDE